MFEQRFSKSVFAACGLVLASFCPDAGSYAAQAVRSGFVLTSTTFRDGGPLPQRVAFTMCGGENLSPELSWAKIPPGTKSFAITETTVEGGDGLEEFNLVVYGIPAGVTALAEGELSKASDKYTGGKNRFGQGTWRGMCAPAGAAPHHYLFKIIATDLEPKELPPGLTWEDLQGRIKGHMKDSAAIIGTFVRE